METKNKDTHFPFLVVTILLIIIHLGAVRLYYAFKYAPVGKRIEVSGTIGDYRKDLERILSTKIIRYATLAEASRGAASKEIDGISDLLDLPNNRQVMMYFYSPNGKAKSFSDENVSAVVIKSDSGWELAKINFREDWR